MAHFMDSDNDDLQNESEYSSNHLSTLSISDDTVLVTPRSGAHSLIRRNGESEAFTILPHNSFLSSTTSTIRGGRSADILCRLRSSQSMQRLSLGPRRDGALMIPSVAVTVTPFLHSDKDTLEVYAVRIRMPAPADSGSDWFEFRLTQLGPSDSLSSHQPDGSSRPPRVEVASVSVEGVPVKFEIRTMDGQGENQSLTGMTRTGSGVPLEASSENKWVGWLRIHVGNMGGGSVVVDYVVRELEGVMVGKGGKRRSNIGGKTRINVVLPSFSLPVGALELIVVDTVPGLHIVSLFSNLAHQHVLTHGRRLLQYSIKELFDPQLALDIRFDPTPDPHRPSSITSQLLRFMIWSIPSILSIVLLLGILSLRMEIRRIKSSLDILSLGSSSRQNDNSHRITVTSTWTPAPTQSTISPLLTVVMPSSSPSSTSSLTDSKLKPRSTSSSKSSPNDTIAFLPVEGWLFPWSLRFNLDLPAVHTKLQKVMEGLGAVWQVFRNVYDNLLASASQESDSSDR